MPRRVGGAVAPVEPAASEGAAGGSAADVHALISPATRAPTATPRAHIPSPYAVGHGGRAPSRKPNEADTDVTRARPAWTCSLLSYPRRAVISQVISLVLAHIAVDHPDLAETETADDLRGWIELLPD